MMLTGFIPLLYLGFIPLFVAFSVSVGNKGILYSSTMKKEAFQGRKIPLYSTTKVSSTKIGRTIKTATTKTSPITEDSNYFIYSTADSKLKSCCQSPKNFLLHNKPGPYTCIRTIDKSVLMLDYHLDRLQEGIQKCFTTVSDYDKYRKDITKIVKKSLKQYFKGKDNKDEEAFLTILVSTPEENESIETKMPKIFAHIMPLASIPKEAPIMSCEILGNKRRNPRIKHSQWCKDRIPLEEKKNMGIDEVILTRNIGYTGTELLEGLVSNFFVIQNGTVRTSHEDVLEGHVRYAVFEACKKLGIPLELRPPHIADKLKWSEAFLTGAGKILAPVHAIWHEDDVTDDPLIKLKSHEPNSLTEKIRNCLLTEILPEHCTPLLAL